VAREGARWPGAMPECEQDRPRPKLPRNG